MCMGTIRVLASGPFVVCSCHRGTKQNREFSPGPGHARDTSTPHHTAPLHDLTAVSRLPMGMSATHLEHGQKAPRIWEPGRLPGPAQRAWKLQGCFFPPLDCFRAGRRGWLAGAMSQYFCLESALRGAVCLDQQKHALNSFCLKIQTNASTVKTLLELVKRFPLLLVQTRG